MPLIRQACTVLLAITALVGSAAFITAVPPEKPGCEYEGDLLAGDLGCVSWDDEVQPGGDGTPGGDEAEVTPAGQSGSGDERVCRNGDGGAVPCVETNENGDTCRYAGPIGAGGGAAGSAAYICVPPGDDEADDASGGPAPPASPVVLAWRAMTSMELRAVDLQIAPTPVADDPESMGLVGLPVWLWADDAAGTWGPQTATASDGPVSVTVTARADRVEFDMGDGTTVTCTGHPDGDDDDEQRKLQPGTPFDLAQHTAEDESPDCGHIYLRTSDDQPDGLYTVTATSYWTAEWEDNTGQTGTIPFDFTATAQIRIGELQVIRTGSN